MGMLQSQKAGVNPPPPTWRKQPPFYFLGQGSPPGMLCSHSSFIHAKSFSAPFSPYINRELFHLNCFMLCHIWWGNSHTCKKPQGYIYSSGLWTCWSLGNPAVYLVGSLSICPLLQSTFALIGTCLRHCLSVLGFSCCDETVWRPHRFVYRLVLWKHLLNCGSHFSDN